MKFAFSQVAQRSLAEQVPQFKTAHVTQVPVELMAKLFAHAEQKLLELQVVH